MGLNDYYFVFVLLFLNHHARGDGTGEVKESANQNYLEKNHDESSTLITKCYNCKNDTSSSTPSSFSTSLLTQQESIDRYENSDEATNIIWTCSSCKNINPKISHFSLSLQNMTAKIQWKSLDETKEECKFKYNINSSSTSIISYFRRIDTNTYNLGNLKPCKNYSLTIEPSNICSSGEIFRTYFFTDPIEIEEVLISFNNEQTNISWVAAETEDCYKYKINIDGMIYETISDKYFVDSTELICKKIGIQSIREDGKLGTPKYQQKPGKVFNLKVNFINGTNYLVRWDANVNSECVNSYLIDVNSIKSKTNETQNILNFPNYCTTYEIKVAALSKYDSSDFVNEIITTRIPDKLNDVEDVSFTYSNLTKALIVTWKQKFLENDKNCKYNYYIKNINYETNSTSYVFSDVKHCSNYSAEVVTTLSNIYSKGKLAWFVVPGKDPDLPILKSVLVSNDSSTLHFEMVNFESYSCDLKSLEIFCKANNESNRDLNWIIRESAENYLFNQRESSFKVELKNLSPYTNYTCHWILHATNNSTKMGTSFEFQTSEGAPSKPEKLLMVDRNASSFGINWAQPLKIPGIINSYEIEIKPQYSLHFIPKECNDLIYLESMVNLLNNNTNYYEFLNAHPSYRYEIRLKAKIKDYYGPESQLFINTEDLAPEAPPNFNVSLAIILEESYNVTATLSWNYPCKPNGEIEYFLLNIKETSVLTNETAKYIANIEVNNTIENPNYSYVMTNIKPLKHYELRLNGVLKDGTIGKEAVIKFSSPDGLPGPPGTISIENITPSNFIINWEEPVNINGLIQNYEIKITTINPIHTIPADCEKIEQEYTIDIPDNTTTYNFTKALPNYLYLIEIRAKTNSGFGEWFKVEHASLKGNPERVRNLSHKMSIRNSSNYDANITMSFEQPCNLNGDLINYQVTIIGTREGYGGFVHNFIVKNFTYEIVLLAEFNYTLEMVTYTNGGNSTTTGYTFTSPSGAPILNNVTSTINKMTPNSADVVINQSMFQDDNGKLLYYAIILSQVEYSSGNKGDYGFWDGVNWPEMTTWNEINDSIYPYQATPKNWNPFTNNDNYYQNASIIYTLGVENCSKTTITYCNGPLRNKTIYAMVVRAFTKGAYRDAPPIYFETPSFDDDDDIWGIIIGVSLGVIAVVLLVTMILCWRKRKTKDFHEYTEEIVIDRHDYSVLKFPQHYDEISQNPDVIKTEYKTLGVKSSEFVLPKNDAVLPQNRKKNRYTNILPYDESRVILRNCDESSNYINASYIRGYTNDVEYIATQGPLESTVSDFWKMVVEEKVSVIVMVAQIVEQRKEKCFKYFPDNQENMETEHGWLVSCVSELVFEYYCEKHIILEKENETHKIIHLQFLNWPDFDCPEGTDNMLNFCKVIKEHNVNKEIVLVHCSAGVGRTGTLIAIDILLQAIKNDDDIDVFNTVLDLRKQRQNMVQTEAQYLYIYTCLFNAITKPQELLEIKASEPPLKNMDILEMQVLDKSDTNDNIKVINEETDIS